MKLNYVFSVLFFFLFFFNTNSQEDDSLQTVLIYELSEVFETDNTFKLINNYLPIGWTFYFKYDTLIFYSTSHIYKIDKGSTDTVKHSKRKLKTIKKEELDTAKIYFRVEPLWDETKIFNALNRNNVVQFQIDNLPEKHNISHLINILNSGDFDIESSQFTENEKKNIIKYFKSKTYYETELITTPSFHTQKYSLFFLKIYPETHVHNQYFPQDIIQNINYIFELFEKYAGK